MKSYLGEEIDINNTKQLESVFRNEKEMGFFNTKSIYWYWLSKDFIREHKKCLNFMNRDELYRFKIKFGEAFFIELFGKEEHEF